MFRQLTLLGTAQLSENADAFPIDRIALVCFTVVLTAVLAATLFHRIAECLVGDRVITLSQMLWATGFTAVLFLLWSLVL